MAATNLQETSYKTERVALIGSPQQRDGTTFGKDQRFVNFFPEMIKTKTKVPLFGEPRGYYLRSRPGTLKVGGGVNAPGRGVIYFSGHIYWAAGNILYRDNTAVQTLDTSSGTVGFSPYQGIYSALIVLDGTSGWVVKTDLSITKIVDANFPTPHVPHPVSLDGYVFAAKAGTADIYNCNVNDPFTWSASQFITAEMYPETIVNLTKNQNYLYAIGTSAIEYFSDAGIATGSPLARNAAAVQQYGCPAPESVAQTDIEVILVGENNNGGRTVYKVSGFKSEDIGIPALSQWLNSLSNTINTTAFGYVIRSLGHKWYILNGPTRTWVYDFEESMWHEWCYRADGTTFMSNYGADYIDSRVLLIHNVDGSLLLLDETVHTDYYNGGAVPIACSATTVRIDGGTNKRKSCNRLTLIGDSPLGVANTQYEVSWSDDDYNTWTTPIILQMNPYMSAISQLGSFRRRAFKITYSQPYPSRLEGMELNINIGNF